MLIVGKSLNTLELILGGEPIKEQMKEVKRWTDSIE